MRRRIAAGTTHTVDVERVVDGDTVRVRFPEDGMEDTLRIIGVDTPETKRNQRFERVAEWRGVDDPATLLEWADRASAFARERLAGATVALSFDQNEPVRDEFDRLLVYLEYDRDGRRVLYNRELLAEGYARTYESGMGNHDAFADAEAEARAAGRGLWAESEQGEPVRNRAVDELFVPRATSVRTADGRLPPERAPVHASGTATQELRGADAVRYEETVPLVGVDRDARVALVGGLVVNEAYEAAEGFAVDTSSYGQFPFLTTLATWLADADREGAVLVDGGHGGFGADYGLSVEDVAYYRRYLEGQGVALEQRNRLPSAFLDGGRALLVTSPVGPFGTGELDRVRAFRDDGGAVVLLASAAAPAFAREHLNRVAAGLGSDLRANADRVRDEHRNLAGDPTLPVTSDLDRSVPLFGAYADGPRPALDLVEVVADPEGDDREVLADEVVTLANRGTEPLDLTGWTLRDLAGRTYAFPDGFELDADATVAVHTGAGTDTTGDLFWDAGRPVWNNRGDTVVVVDADGLEALRVSY